MTERLRNRGGLWYAALLELAERPRVRTAFTVLYLLGLYLAGVLAWYYFLNGGDIPLEYHDWAEVTAPRLAFLKDSIESWQLPLHMPGPWALRNVTDRYLALPDTLLSPLAITLRFMEVGEFIVFNTLSMFTVGFIGLLTLRRELELSLLPTTFLFGLVFFNGSITAHISVGHANWTAYLLLPFVMYLILRMFHKEETWPWVAWWSLLTVIILLQGAFHFYVALSLLLLVVAIFVPRLWRQTLLGILVSGLAGSARLLPPVLEASKQDTEFLSGFASLTEMLQSLIDIRVPGTPGIIRASGLSPLGWWEIDHFVGIAGLILIGYFGIYLWLKQSPATLRYMPLLGPVIVLLTFSLGRTYRLFHLLRIPILDSQRVSTRLFIVPFTILIVIAVINLNRWWKEAQPSPMYSLMSVVGLVWLGHDLWQHFKLWRVARLHMTFPSKDLDLSLNFVANHTDPAYTSLIVVGLMISFLSGGFLVYKSRAELR